MRSTLLALTIAAFAALAAFVLARPQILLVSVDSPGYLIPSISALSGEGFRHTDGRGFVYPLVVYASVLISGDLSGILGIQNILYWLMLVMLVSLIWIRIDPRQRNQRSIGSLALSTLVSAALVITYLSYSPAAIAASSLGPELLYGFLAIVSSGALIYGFAERRGGGTAFIAAMCISIFAAIANVLVKPQWIFGAAFITATWLIVLAISGLHLRSKIAVLASMTFVVLAALVLPERYLVEKYDPRATLFGPKTFFCNHADLIVRAARIKPEQWAHLPKDFSRPALDHLEATLAERDGWPLLGFNGDRCMYSAAFDALVNKFHANDVPSIRAFYMTMFVNSVLTEPGLYLKKVTAQMVFALRHPLWDSRFAVHATDDVARELIKVHNESDRLFAVPMNGPILGIFAQHLPRIDRFMARLTSGLLNRLALVAIGTALLCWWLFRSMGLPISATPAFAIVVVTGAWFGQALTVAVSHSFDVGRYFWTTAPLLIGATFLSISLIAQTVPAIAAAARRAFRASRKSSR